jgi:hypothetical protein
MSPSLIDRVAELIRSAAQNPRNQDPKAGENKGKTSFAVRPRTRLSFAYFSLEDKEK